MWNHQNTFDADVSFAVRMVLTGHATPEQAATACGVSLWEVQALVASAYQQQPRLQAGH